jgi:hypothetical protein
MLNFQSLMRGHRSNHVLARRMMVELLVTDGCRWAGWYSNTRLRREYDRRFGAFMRGSFGMPFRPQRAEPRPEFEADARRVAAKLRRTGKRKVGAWR